MVAAPRERKQRGGGSKVGAPKCRIQYTESCSPESDGFSAACAGVAAMHGVVNIQSSVCCFKREPGSQRGRLARENRQSVLWLSRFLRKSMTSCS